MRFRITGLALLALAITTASILVTHIGQADPQPLGRITGHVLDPRTHQPIPGALVQLVGTAMSTTTDERGEFVLEDVRVGTYRLIVSCAGFQVVIREQLQVTSAQTVQLEFHLVWSGLRADTLVVADALEAPDAPERDVPVEERRTSIARQSVSAERLPTTAAKEFAGRRDFAAAAPAPALIPGVNIVAGPWNTENYAHVTENTFLEVVQNPLSTFSIDVDAASYSNVRRFVNGGQLPPADAVRIEEMVNYFTYDYPQPAERHPFAIVTELSDCPWNPEHQLVHIGLQGKQIKTEDLPPSNLVFLLDVSGSMRSPNKLPLLKSAFRMLVQQLRPQDRVAIVVYAGAAGMVLPSTPGSDKETITAALDRLQAGGTTAGAAGIRLAYRTARENFRKDGNNRVILATDGDFNVGVSSDAELVRMIEEKREDGIFLTVLGFGMGNLKDSRMEQLADKGNGNYDYIDNIREARKVLVSEMGGTLVTIAKDVKIQVEFNPARVQAYRLVGYENRLLAKEDFNDDTKDAGELGAGHTVTAMYELVPADAEFAPRPVDSLKYQTVGVKPNALAMNEVMTIKLRYKPPHKDQSRLITRTLEASDTPIAASSDNFRFAAAVAEFGMILRDSKFKGTASYGDVIAMAQDARGDDAEGYRSEFISLVKLCQSLERVHAER